MKIRSMIAAMGFAFAGVLANAPAQAATQLIGPFDSTSGTVTLPTVVLTPNRGYEFTVTGHVAWSATVSFSNSLDWNAYIELTPSPVGIAIADGLATSSHFTFTPPTSYPESPALLSVGDLGPGTYDLITLSTSGTLSGFMKFAAIPAATPIPGALPLFVSALGGLGFVGWRRKRNAAGLAFAAEAKRTLKSPR